MYKYSEQDIVLHSARSLSTSSINRQRYYSQEVSDMAVLNAFPDSKAAIFPNTAVEDGEETVLSWPQLPTNVWFRIVAQKDIRKKNGEQVKILNLLREGGAICRVWTTPIIACKIEGRRLYASNNFPAHLYIKSKGKINSHLHADRSYYDCTLLYY